MIERLDISGIHLDVNSDIHSYIVKKIGRLDHFISRNSRASVHAEVFLKESRAKDKKSFSCEVVVHLPKDILTAKESTLNMFASVDIVEAKLRNLLKKYKDKHDSSKLRRRFAARFRRSSRG